MSILKSATDRSPQVATLMRNKYTGINHQYDVWHFVKSIQKKLAKISKKKDTAELVAWIPSIANHIWWCSATCQRNTTLLKDKYLSLLQHITNRHNWSCMAILRGCEYEPLTAEQKKKKWLKQGSPAFESLRKVFEEKKRLSDLSKLTHFCHTGALENLHSLMTMMCPKRSHFI